MHHHDGRESNFVDGSDHFFTMYMEMAREDDKKMAERLQTDADRILVFVRTDYSSLQVVPASSLSTDRSILCYRCDITCDINPGPPA
jgi:hypothetical protein